MTPAAVAAAATAGLEAVLEAAFEAGPVPSEDEVAAAGSTVPVPSFVSSSFTSLAPPAPPPACGDGRFSPAALLALLPPFCLALLALLAFLVLRLLVGGRGCSASALISALRLRGFCFLVPLSWALIFALGLFLGFFAVRAFGVKQKQPGQVLISQRQPWGVSHRKAGPIDVLSYVVHNVCACPPSCPPNR